MYDMSGKAKDLAMHVHMGQKYGKHDYLNYHIQGVVDNLERHIEQGETFLRWEDEIETATCVAWLHDSVEDTFLTSDEIESQFGREISSAVLKLTKSPWFNKETDLIPYLEKIKEDPIARIVKICDIEFNANECRKEGRQEKYEYYIKQLKFLIAA